MKKDLGHFIWAMGLGVALVAYAHANFASKSTVEKMDERVYEIWKEVVKK